MTADFEGFFCFTSVNIWADLYVIWQGSVKTFMQIDLNLENMGLKTQKMIQTAQPYLCTIYINCAALNAYAFSGSV